MRGSYLISLVPIGQPFDAPDVDTGVEGKRGWDRDGRPWRLRDVCIVRSSEFVTKTDEDGYPQVVESDHVAFAIWDKGEK